MKLSITWYKAAACLAALALCLQACQMEDDLKGSKKQKSGYLDVTLTPQATEPMLTRAVANDTYDLNEFPTAIIDTESGDTVLRYNTYRELKLRGEVAIPAGNYRLLTWYGSNEANVQDTPYFEANKTFTVQAGAKSIVEAVCKLGRVKVSVDVDSDFERYFEEDYSLTFNNEHGVETMDRDSKDKAYYFKLYEGDKYIDVEVKATPKGSEQTVSKRFTLYKQGENGEDGSALDFEAGDAFKINLSPTDSVAGTVVNPTEGNFVITADLKWNDRNEEVSVPIQVIDTTAPSTGDGEADNSLLPTLTPDINGVNTWQLELAENESAQLTVDIQAPATIQQLLVKITSTNATFAGTVSGMSLAEFDLCHIPAGSDTETYVSTLLGLSYNEDVLGQTQFTFDVSAFTGALSMFAGTHQFALTVIDGQGNQATGTLIITSKE
jgi:hypothetical protein